MASGEPPPCKEMTEGLEREFHADKILISTGSTPTIPPIEGLANTPFWTSTEALFSECLPKHLVVISSSVVALEIAHAYRRLGNEVTIIARHTLLYKEDPLLGEKLTERFEKEGLHVLKHTEASRVLHDGELFQIKTNMGSLNCDKLLISTGRHANTTKLNLTVVDLDTNRHGAIINDRMETNVSGIYAAGDCSSMPQFVYVAAAAGSRAGST
jgi:mercuric reductase